MAVEIEKTGKTIAEAKMAALQELQVSEDMVDFEVIEEPSKGFLGLIGNKPARIKARIKEVKPVDKAMDFLSKIFAAMHLEVKIDARENEDGYVLNLVGDNLGILIGKHGQTLDSLQYLANLTANKGLFEDKVRIILDIENYRTRREETLRRLALRLADKVRHTGERIVLEPMNRHERKIIHMALQDNYRISTYSSGDEPYRKVVIEPKRSGRRDRDRRDRERIRTYSSYSRPFSDRETPDYEENKENNY